MTLLLLACWEATPTDSGFVEPVDTSPVLEIIGDYLASDGAVVVVSSTSWRTDDRTDTIVEFSNSSNMLTAENDHTSDVAGTYSRYDWRSDGGQWFVCRSTETAETAEDAALADRAPDDDCNGADWVSLTLAL
ncbi:MAG: hypothetical protein GY913_10050 [Proteobacteria bacterium]|nr:hypothetical protein [Pseudomonadota bacterium]MCP4917255.1 hypothetical protein [Pseudomonadota bacterium]